MKIRLSITLGAILLLTGAAFCQTVAFEVATVRPSAPLDIAKLAANAQAGQMPRFGANIDGSRATYTYMTLKELIANAYKVKAYQVTGPDWIASQRYDISAKLPEGATADDAPRMLQALLTERFHLVGHHETEEHPVLALVVGKGGPKLKEAPPPTDPPDPDTPDGRNRITRNPDGSSTVNMGAKGSFTQRMEGQVLHMKASSITMEGFADMLTNLLGKGSGGRQVVDQTGLKGNYQVAIDLSMADMIAAARSQGMDIPTPRTPTTPSDTGIPTTSDPSGGSTIYSSVEALGLKLENRKAQVDQIVIDRIEKTPTDN